MNKQTKEIFEKLKDIENLFYAGNDIPVGQQWISFYREMSSKKYIICNMSEEEPAVFESAYLLDSKIEELVKGLKVAGSIFSRSKIYLYLRPDFYKNYKKKLISLIGNDSIILFCKTNHYLCGEEKSAIISDIENGFNPPRIESYKNSFIKGGLKGYPTLINTAEIFYRLYQIKNNIYDSKRFYSISGDVKKEGVSEVPIHLTVKEVINFLNIEPRFKYFLQIGGGAVGEIKKEEELDFVWKKRGSLVFYNYKKTDKYNLMLRWANFFLKANCDKCTPCREGLYRLKEMLQKNRKDKILLNDILFVLKNTSYCSFGKRLTVPFYGVLNKLFE